MNLYITDIEVLVEKISRFTCFIRHVDGHDGPISFRDSTGFLGINEDFKSTIAEEARKELKLNEWKESWIGTGKIAQCASKAISKAGILVYKQQQIDFKNRLNPRHSKYNCNAERVLYDIFRNPCISEAQAFSAATEVFGAKYDTIAFLFFVKDGTRFLPISTSHFDAGFAALKIDFLTSHRCSWENYQGFISIIDEIREIMERTLPIQGTLRLIDAHSFVWIIQQKRFQNWVSDDEEKIQIEEQAEKMLQSVVSGRGDRRKVEIYSYNRSTEVVKETRRRAAGKCQYCKMPAPFVDINGQPYLEVHHIIWLSRGGKDSTENTVALCPNCHSRMHVLDDPDDIQILMRTLEDGKS